MKENYKVLVCATRGDLQEAVNDQMTRGFVPLGGVAIDMSQPAWAQAMIRKSAASSTPKEEFHPTKWQ